MKSYQNSILFVEEKTKSTQQKVLNFDTISHFFLVLAHNFPELKLSVPSRSKHALHYHYWKDVKNQRKFFDQLSKEFNIFL